MCPDEDAVLAYARGGGDAASRSQIEAHVDRCETCLELIVHAARFAAASTDGGDVRGRVDEPPDSMRYEIGREIARGGMGRIFEAHDRVLGRAVAIKCIREDRASLDARFAREVALTALLEHPAIVPIHDAGRLPDGRRFYAMRLIGGKPLDVRIAEAPELDGRLALLVHFIALADAMAYVHSQGVIHRDLKPHNVLIGDFGETVLVDWGLAKKLDDPDPAGAPTTADAEMATLDGEIVGTRGYMAPEQAAGGTVGLAADVYGLGATLLHLITGRAPTLPIDLQAIPELRKVSPDLAAIVTRALANDPEQRYPSARELAGDLHRFQAGRLVEAHQYTARQLVLRWLAHHRKAVAFSTAALVAIAAISAIAVRRIVDEREIARAERARAEEHRDGAQALIAFTLVNTRDELEKVGRLDALANAAREVVRYYDGIHDSSERSTDRLHRAMAIGLLGQTEGDRGHSEDAVRLLRQSVTLARESLAQQPSPLAAQELGRALHELGSVGRLVHAPDASAALRDCETMARARLSGPDAGTWRWLLANTNVDLAIEAHDHNDDVAAERLLREAIDVASASDAADDPRGTHALVLAATRLAQLYEQQDQWDKASPVIETMQAAALRDVARSPRDPDLQLALAVAWLSTGDLRQRQHRLDDAAAAFREAHRIDTALVAIEPSNATWSQQLGIAEQRLGYLARARGDSAEAIAHFTASRDISARWVAQDPHNWSLLLDLAYSELDLGRYFTEQKDYDKARIAMKRSLELFQQIDKESPNAKMKQNVAMTWSQLGELEMAAHQPATARTHLEHATELCRSVLPQADTPLTRELLASALIDLAVVAPERANASLAEANEVMAPLRTLAADDPDLRQLLARLDQQRATSRMPR